MSIQMSIILESLEKKFKRADSGDEETLNQYPYNVDFSGADLESCGVLTKPLTKCAIHILLFRKNKELCILFTIRSRNLKNFPGEICFPGGKFDITADKSLLETAERETFEEIGLTKKNYQNLAKLTPFITINGHYIQPIIALVCHDNEPLDDKFEDTFSVIDNLKLNNDEVDSLFWLPLRYFKECLSTMDSRIFNLVKIPMKSSGSTELNYLEGIIGQIPEFYTQIFFNVNDLHLIYGFNSFFVLVTVFLNEDADTSQLNVEIDPVNLINSSNILQFVQNMNKCSYVIFVKNKNKELVDKENKSKL